MRRRDAMRTMGAAALLASGISVGESVPAPEPTLKRSLKPLPFNPTKLKGLSERLLRSHHENNYGGALKNLLKVEGELARVTKDTPPHLVAGLKERELTFRNSVVLHEWYFGNLGGDGKPGGAIVEALARSHGSFATFEEQFRALGASLGGGSGWAILAYDPATSAPRAYWSGHHTQGPAGAQPLLVMDMYEHAYALDFGAAAGKYIDAFFQNLDWEVVDRRFAHARKLAALP